MHDYKIHIVMYVTSGIKFKRYFKLPQGMRLSSGGDNVANRICLETFQFMFKPRKILYLVQRLFGVFSLFVIVCLFSELLHKLKCNA